MKAQHQISRPGRLSRRNPVRRRYPLGTRSLAIGTLCTLVSVIAQAEEADYEYRGNLELELQSFLADADHSADQKANTSVSGVVELYKELNDGNGSVVLTPFFRIDKHDDKRSHLDLREFLFSNSTESWDLRAGLGKVFWGVAESSNIVNIVNQSDAVEGFTSDEKLGQPMLQASRTTEKGDFDFFILPGFRTRTFPGLDGRPRPPIEIDTDNAIYEDSEENKHVDFAARYSNAIEEWDIGLSWFKGTSRDPLLVFNPASLSLQPYYYQVQQFGIDVQATLESWLLKLEMTHRAGKQIDNHMNLVSGFEYSFYSVGESDTDIGIVFEYLYDDLGDDAYQPFQNDILFGLRFALNDEQSTEALVGILADVTGGGQIFTLEASRRIGNSFKVSLESATWLNTEEDPQLDGFKNEDLVTAKVAWFF